MPRVAVLDGLRGLAAIAVVVHHCTQNGHSPMFAGAGLAVDLFFCVSGFVIARIYLPRLQAGMGMRAFLSKRLRRLFPMHLIGWLLGLAALAGAVVRETTTLSWGQFGFAGLCNVLFLPFLGDYHITQWGKVGYGILFPTNAPAWSLFSELLINIVFALPIIFIRRWMYLVLVSLAVIGLIAWIKLTWHSAPGWGIENIVGGIPRVTYGFMMGALIASIEGRIRKYSNGSLAIPAWAILALACVVLYASVGPLGWLLESLILVPVIVLAATISVPPGIRQCAVLSWLGWLSYPLYCVHYPILSFASLYWATGASSFGLEPLFVVLPISLLVAYVAARLTNEPMPKSGS